MVKPSSKLVAEVVAPLLKQVENLTAGDLRPLLRKPLDEILRDLDSRDRHRAGLALEALAFKLMRLVDLSYVATRLRGAATGGAEVDLIFESSRLVYSRWQVQCKNTLRVSLDDVAKEVGLTYQTGSQVLLFVGMGGVDKLATELARAACASRPLQIAFLTRRDLKAIVERPLSIVERIARQAPLALCTTSQFSPFLEKTAHASASSLSVA
jgi:site-specific DNA-methyltransferase (cytosine-N4-specific)